MPAFSPPKGNGWLLPFKKVHSTSFLPTSVASCHGAVQHQTITILRSITLRVHTICTELRHFRLLPRVPLCVFSYQKGNHDRNWTCDTKLLCLCSNQTELHDCNQRRCGYPCGVVELPLRYATHLLPFTSLLLDRSSGPLLHLTASAATHWTDISPSDRSSDSISTLWEYLICTWISLEQSSRTLQESFGVTQDSFRRILIN